MICEADENRPVAVWTIYREPRDFPEDRSYEGMRSFLAVNCAHIPSASWPIRLKKRVRRFRRARSASGRTGRSPSHS
jgi:hypothetical protein